MTGLYQYYDHRSFRTILLHSIREYASFVNELGEKKYLYRGQSNPAWSLENSFLRLHNEYKEKGLSPPGEREMIENFRNNAVKYGGLDDDFESLREIDLLGIMQHYGVKTRMLDFTECPFIAAYFALNARLQSIEEPLFFTGAVFFIHKDLVTWDLPEEAISKFWVFSKQKKSGISYSLFALKPNNYSGRLKSQRAIFLFMHDPFLSYEYKIQIEKTWYNIRALSQSEKGTAFPPVWKVVFRMPISELAIFFNALTERGIDERKLYPDFQGFCSSLNFPK